MSKCRVLAAAGVMLAVAVPAQARDLVTSQTCRAVRATVDRNGSAILHTSPTVFDRYVRNATFCQPGDELRSAFLPTVDDKRCFVGFTCRTWSVTKQ